MSDDIQVNSDTSITNFLNNQNDISDIPQRVGFIPYLTIAYGTSASVLDGKASPGDFVFEGKTTLGKKVEVIVADFRLHLSVWDDTTSSTISDCYASSNNPNRGKDKDYLDFAAKKLPEGCKLNSGIDLLLWLPVVNSFAIIYLKSTTYDAFAPIYTAGRGGRLVQLTARQETNSRTKRKFFLIDCLSLNRAVVNSKLAIPGVDIICDISIPTEFALSAIKSFKDIKNEEVSSENVQRER